MIALLTSVPRTAVFFFVCHPRFDGQFRPKLLMMFQNAFGIRRGVGSGERKRARQRNTTNVVYLLL